MALIQFNKLNLDNCMDSDYPLDIGSISLLSSHDVLTVLSLSIVIARFIDLLVYEMVMLLLRPTDRLWSVITEQLLVAVGDCLTRT